MKAKDLINPVKWASFCYGMTLRFLMPEHILEQYVVRRYEENCRPCVEAGHCVGPCDCAIPAKMMVPWETCASGWWGPMKNKGDWEQYKKDQGIKIEVSWNKSN